MFCMMRWRGDRIRATKEVEKSISMMDTLPSSLLNILEKGSVWYIRKPLEVPGKGVHISFHHDDAVVRARDGASQV